MSSLKVKLGILAAGLMLSGCMQATTYEATNQTNFKPRDKELLAKIRYTNAPVAEPFRRAIVDYHRKEAPGSIVVDSDNHYLYYVLNDGKAIRYGITVGEEAMAWSGIAKIGSMTEWPPWHPTKSEIERLGVPTFVAPGPDNPMGSRALYLYSGGKDTLFRIHGTNQPEYIGASISSGCIRMTNEDVIDLYNRVKMGTIVVVLEPHHGDSPFNSQMALQGGGSGSSRCSNRPRSVHDEIKSAGFTGAFLLAAWSASAGRSGVRLGASDLAASDFVGIGFGGDLARRGFIRPLGRQQRRDRRQRVPHVPLADLVIVVPLHQIEMDVVLVIPVRARPQHRGEPRAHRMQHALAQLARHRAVGERDRLAVGELHAANVERVGAAVFGQSGADHAVAAAAFERVEIVEIADDAAEACRQRRHVGADPVRDRGGHRAAQDRRGLDRDPVLVRQHHGLQPDQILAAATAGAMDVGNAGGDRDLF